MLVCFVQLGRYECIHTRASVPAIIYWSDVNIKPNVVITPDFINTKVACENQVRPKCCMRGSPYIVKLIFGIERGIL